MSFSNSNEENFFSDFGVYMLIEQLKTLDDRLTVNLLLGAHLLMFRANDKYFVRFSAPQGVEVGFQDFLKKNYKLGIGGFFYPLFFRGVY